MSQQYQRTPAPGGNGASLPSNASGFLHNDGAGALAWQAAGGGFPSANADTATTGALQVGKHHYVSAAAGNVSRALPTTANAGDLILLEKSDSSTNMVSATGSIRGSGSATFSLKLPNESILFECDGANSWWPTVGHKTLASTDTRYSPLVETSELFAASGAAVTLGNPTTTGSMKDVTLTANCTISVPAVVSGASFMVRVKEGGSGGYTATFSGPVQWGASGVQPSNTLPLGSKDEYVFHCWPGDTFWTGGLGNKDIK